MVNKKTLFSLIGLFILLVVVFLFFKNQTVSPPAKIITVSPAPQANQVSLLPEITVVFDKNIDPGKVQLSSIPVFDYRQTTPDAQASTIKYLPSKLLEKKTLYKLTLEYSDGEKYSWSFTTSETEAGAVPGWSEAFQKQKIEYEKKTPPHEVDIYNQIIEQTPYFGSGFWISHSLKRNVFTVYLCQKPHEQTQQKAQGWLDEKGFQELIVLMPPIEWIFGCNPPKTIP